MSRYRRVMTVIRGFATASLRVATQYPSEGLTSRGRRIATHYEKLAIHFLGY